MIGSLLKSVRIYKNLKGTATNADWYACVILNSNGTGCIVKRCDFSLKWIICSKEN